MIWRSRKTLKLKFDFFENEENVKSHSIQNNFMQRIIKKELHVIFGDIFKIALVSFRKQSHLYPGNSSWFQKLTGAIHPQLL